MRRLALPLWFVGLGIVLFGLVVVETDRLPLPPVEILDWITANDVEVIVFGSLRGLCVLGVAYLMVTTLLVAISGILRSSKFTRTIELFCGQSLLGFNRRLLGLSMIGILATPSTAGATADAPILRSLTAATTSTTVVTPPPVVPQALVSTWTVEPGDNLWTIAQAVLAERSMHAPTERETADYWIRLLAENDSLLTDADIITPGTQLTLPK